MIRSFSILPFVSFLGLAAAAGGQTAAPVIDLNTSTELSESSSYPSQLTAVRGGRIVFAASTQESGRELWTSDGTASGSRMLFDACPGDCDSDPEILGTLGGVSGLALVVASAEVPGREDRIWATDGRQAGTFVLTDNGTDLVVMRKFTDSPDLSYFPFDHAFLAGSMLFAACGGDRGCGLWATDGTTAGTRLVASGSDLGGSPAQLTATDHAVFFTASPASVPELWTTDGSTQGTRRLAGLNGPPRAITAAGAKVFFLAEAASGEELWVSDGTEAGTRPLTQLPPVWPFGIDPTDFQSPPVIAAFGSRVYFAADDLVHGWEIWRSDGTVEGTLRITDFADRTPFSLPSLRSGMAEVKGRLIFPASAGKRGWALWTAGGNPPSASVLKDCLSGCGRGRPYGGLVTATGGRAVFFLAGAEHGTELWSTDGTAAGTRELRGFCAGPCDLTPTYGFVPLRGRLAFALKGITTNPDLWWTDGTPAGTRPLTHLTGGVLSGNAVPAAVGSRIFFSAGSAAGGQELWVIDKGKARQVANLSEDAGSSSPTILTPLGDRLVFQARGSFAADGLWQTGGTAAATSQLAENVSLFIPPPSDCPPDCFHLLAAVDPWIVFVRSVDAQGFQLWRTGDSPATPGNTLQLTSLQGPDSLASSLAVMAGRAFFIVQGYDHLELWRSDGTPAGTLQVASIPVAGFPASLDVAGGALWLGVDSDDASSIWRSDGTAAGTVEVATLPREVEAALYTPFVAAGGRVFFVAHELIPGHADQLWVTDGTAAGTAPVMGGAGVTLLEMRELSGALLFFAAEHDGQSGGLYRSDGTPAGTVRLHDFAFLDIRDPDRPHGLTPFAGRLFFGASEGSAEKALWSTDGTAAGTVLVKAIDPDSFAVAGDRLFLSAFDDEHGFELWQSDGTPAGTRLVQDIAPGNLSSSPDWLTVAGDRLYFTADDGVIGRELWSLPLTEKDQ